MPFLTQLAITEAGVEDARSFWWRLLSPLEYQGKMEQFIVPEGFITDFASVPCALWSVFPPYGKYTKAAVVHDWLYAAGKVSRKDADGIFSRMMREAGVKWRRPLMWFAVRLFGGRSWKRYRKNGIL